MRRDRMRNEELWMRDVRKDEDERMRTRHTKHTRARDMKKNKDETYEDG